MWLFMTGLHDMHLARSAARLHRAAALIVPTGPLAAVLAPAGSAADALASAGTPPAADAADAPGAAPRLIALPMHLRDAIDVARDRMIAGGGIFLAFGIIAALVSPLGRGLLI